MIIKSFTFPSEFELFANTYVISDSLSNCVIIDSSKESEEIVDYIKSNNLKVKGILLTHGHFDHIRGIEYLSELYDAPVYIHKNDVLFLSDPHLNCSDRFSRKDIRVTKIKIVEIGEKEPIGVLENTIKVIETPYHTMGSVCFYLPREKALISGDSLFFESIGRSDFPGSDSRLISSSLAKLMLLDDDVKVYPGHGVETTIGHEKKQNSFVKK